MVIVKVWSLPKETPSMLNGLRQVIVVAVMGITELRIKSEDDIVTIFPAGMVDGDTDKKIVVEVKLSNGLKHEDLLHMLAERVGLVLRELYKNVRVEVIVETRNPKHSFWSSGS